MTNDRLSPKLDDTISHFTEKLGNSDDFIIQKLNLYAKQPGALFYFNDLVDLSSINRDIMRPLIEEQDGPDKFGDFLSADKLQQHISRHSLSFAQSTYVESKKNATIGMLAGKLGLAVHGLPGIFLIGDRAVAHRSVEEPPTEQVIQGPRDGFIENLETNLGLLRYRLQTPKFKVKFMKIGHMTQTSVAICYLEDIAAPDLIKEVHSRLDMIDTDGILDAGFLEQYIEDQPFSPFPQVQHSERPDKIVANLLEGRVAMIVDGSPFAITVPTVFSQFYQAAEDYSFRFLQGSFIRLARLVALVFSLIVPALYVALVSYNPELIPTEFAVAIAGGRGTVPFPAVVEVLTMEIAMEVLREASIRLPQQVGSALSIVGVLIIGESAVAAGFVSPVTVVVVALTTIGSFATPAYNAAFALRMLRFPIIVIAGTFGLYGIMIGLILICNHLLSLKSFGVPYLRPFVPLSPQGMKDLLVRFPLWSMKFRPASFYPRNSRRVGMGWKDIKARQKSVLDPAQVRKKRRK